jgi:hypothetical protein
MKKCFSLNRAWLFLVAIFIFFSPANAKAQTSSSGFDMTGFPQWAKDLRRGEIVAFGTFPFAYLFTNLTVDTIRYASHDWDRRYAPWPIKSTGSIDLSQKEEFRNLGIAAGSAVLIAVIDHLIVRHKRNKAEEQIRNLPAGTPIIIRKPLDDAGDVIEEAPPPGAGEN